MIELIDTHCHLDFDLFDEDREDVLSRANAAGVENIIVPAIDLDSCQRVLALAERYSSIYAAVGIHPNSSSDWQSSWLDQIRRFATHEKAIAIGEIGLDYYRDYASRDIQLKALRQQLELAADLDLPVILHNRDSNEDLLTILRSSGLAGHPKPGVFHSFSGDVELASKALEDGFFIGFTGPITYKNAESLRNVARFIPLDRILIETDAPFLAPQQHRGKRNEPAYVRYIAEKLSEILSMDYSELAFQTTLNARLLFDLPETNAAN